MNPSDLREQLAALAHTQWSGWMKHLFHVSVYGADNTVIIDKYYVERWKRQAYAGYGELTESEKTSDRKEADRILGLLATHPLVSAESLAEEVSREMRAGLPDSIFGASAEGFARRVASAVLARLPPRVSQDTWKNLSETLEKELQGWSCVGDLLDLWRKHPSEDYQMTLIRVGQEIEAQRAELETALADLRAVRADRNFWRTRADELADKVGIEVGRRADTSESLFGAKQRPSLPELVKIFHKAKREAEGDPRDWDREGPGDCTQDGLAAVLAAIEPQMSQRRPGAGSANKDLSPTSASEYADTSDARHPPGHSLLSKRLSVEQLWDIFDAATEGAGFTHVTRESCKKGLALVLAATAKRTCQCTHEAGDSPCPVHGDDSPGERFAHGTAHGVLRAPSPAEPGGRESDEGSKANNLPRPASVIPLKRPTFEELLKIYRDGRMEVDHQSSEDRDTRSLLHVLAAIPAGVTLPDDETLGRIAWEANHECGWRPSPDFHSRVGATIRARLFGR